jgi:hypothetical protein
MPSPDASSRTSSCSHGSILAPSEAKGWPEAARRRGLPLCNVRIYLLTAPLLSLPEFEQAARIAVALPLAWRARVQ